MGYNIVSTEEINSRETGLGISFTAPTNKVEYLLMLIDTTGKFHSETIARNSFGSIWSYLFKGGYKLIAL